MKAYLTRIDTAFALRLAALLEARGYGILTCDDAVDEPVDLFIATENAHLPGDDFDARSAGSAQAVMDSYHHNLFSPLVQLERLLPHLDKGAGKRLCFLSSRTASVNQSDATMGFGYNMSKASLHTALAIFKNKLIHEGYTFRLFDPMENEGHPRATVETAAQAALTYFLTNRAHENRPSRDRDDEMRLVLRDALGREWPY